MKRSFFFLLTFSYKSGDFVVALNTHKRSDGIVGQLERRTRENRTKPLTERFFCEKVKNQQKRLKNPLTSPERCGNIQAQLNNSPRA